MPEGVPLKEPLMRKTLKKTAGKKEELSMLLLQVIRTVEKPPYTILHQVRMKEWAIMEVLPLMPGKQLSENHLILFRSLTFRELIQLPNILPKNFL